MTTRTTRNESGGGGRSGPTRRATAARPAARPGAPATGRPSGPRGASRPALATAWVRWVVLAAVGLVLLVTLVPTVHSVLDQRARIAALQDQLVEQRAQVAALEAEQARWQDPAYVEQQARERLKFVKVGDRSYSVIDPAQVPRPAVSGATVAAPKADATAPWYAQLWQSVQLADKPTAGMLPPR